MTSAVELAGLTIGYRTRRRTATVAAGLTARARRGELTVLLGPNGAGKSTLIRTLCGLQPALAGQVLLDGADLHRLAPDARARRVAVVLTDRVEPGLLTAREVVAMGRIPYLGFGGRLRRRDDDIIDWALSATGAQQLAARPAAELSDGERQRVLTARALAQQPALLVLDEPTAFLDVSARAGLVGLLRDLARSQHLAVVMSTHDLELALRVADRVWLLEPAGGIVDAVGEELMLNGRIGALFDSDTLRFDHTTGTFGPPPAASGGPARTARIDAPDPLRGSLARVLSREGWLVGEPAELVVEAAGPEAITARSAAAAATVALGELPAALRAWPPDSLRCVPAAQVASALAELAGVSSYFEVAAGPVEGGDWRPVARLHTDPELLGAAIDGVARRIGAPDHRVAASTFFLGFAARLWSIGLGALAEHRMLVDLSPDRLWYRQDDATIRLSLPNPVAWHGAEDLEPRLRQLVLDRHLMPLADAVRRIGRISQTLLLGNAASAALGAARALTRNRAADPVTDPAWRLARAVCGDGRLAGTVRFAESGIDYRRATCCLFYRTPAGGLCVDCALTHTPQVRQNRDRKEAP